MRWPRCQVRVPFGFVPDLQRLAGAMGVWQGSWMAFYPDAELL